MPQFTSENQPSKRGPAFKTKLLDVIKKKALADVGNYDSPEEAFLSHVATRAFDAGDPNSATLLKELLSKSYSSLKATLPEIEFDFDATATPSEQVTQLLEAASKGAMPPDVAITFINAVKAATEIEAATDLKERIEQLEKLLDERTS